MNRTIHLREAAAASPTSPATVRGSLLQGPVRLADLVYGIWALMPDTLRELQAIYETHLRGDKIDIAGVEARLGRPLANEQRPYEIVDGVAVLSMQGVIAPKANLFMKVSGGTSAQMLARDVQAAAADPSAKSILLAVDSPGGSAIGIHELAQTVREAALLKPLVSYCDGVMASAAYWVGSGANAAYISGPMVHVGSIGVVATHQDVSGAEAKLGVKTTEITAGKYKRVTSSYAPLSKEGRAFMQEMVDDCYSLFVDAISTHRGVSVETVLEHMADGRVFVGQRALDAGLVEGYSSLDALIESMATDPARYAKRSIARIKPLDSSPKSSSAGVARADAPTTTTERTDMTTTADAQQGAAAPAPTTAETVKQQHPQVHAAIFAAGAAAERERVIAVRAQTLPGHEKLIEALVADGKTTGPEAAMAVLAAERGAVEAAAKAHANDAPNAAKHSAAPAEAAGAKTRADQVADAKAYAAANNVDFVAACQALGIK